MVFEVPTPNISKNLQEMISLTTTFCVKHDWMPVSRFRVVGGQKIPLCGDCAWTALKNGERLWCHDNRWIELDESGSPVFIDEAE